MDLLRQRGDIFLEHEAAGCPPVFFCDYETVMDGNDLPLKSNYVLLRMIPPQGVNVDDTKRPFIIICPRAGHSPGVGGHKEDSQVGVAFREGHPVYLVSFRREPEGGQYLSRRCGLLGFPRLSKSDSRLSFGGSHGCFGSSDPSGRAVGADIAPHHW
ncbi:DUF3141 domain-containing protein [Rhizobium sp. Pop5]|uniref:DUF3141 domain-containing protein n=2 Tax=Rhizobium/Agrobacterium group TaxID=227290 RepID=UPI001FDA5E14|nr:DUF3141 domain-containing protein [Rhizobium sp. Pop5]